MLHPKFDYLWRNMPRVIELSVWGRWWVFGDVVHLLDRRAHQLTLLQLRHAHALFLIHAR